MLRLSGWDLPPRGDQPVSTGHCRALQGTLLRLESRSLSKKVSRLFERIAIREKTWSLLSRKCLVTCNRICDIFQFPISRPSLHNGPKFPGRFRRLSVPQDCGHKLHLEKCRGSLLGAPARAIFEPDWVEFISFHVHLRNACKPRRALPPDVHDARFLPDECE